jgi:hypothetical protein
MAGAARFAKQKLRDFDIYRNTKFQKNEYLIQIQRLVHKKVLNMDRWKKHEKYPLPGWDVTLWDKK